MNPQKRRRKIDHLIRYFVVIGIVVAAGYANHWYDTVFLILAGPMLYLAAAVQDLLGTLLGPMNYSMPMNLYGFVMPIATLYYGVIGFLLKQLWNEQGFVRFISMLAITVFLIFIHYVSWTNLQAYSIPPT